MCKRSPQQTLAGMKSNPFSWLHLAAAAFGLSVSAWAAEPLVTKPGLTGTDWLARHLEAPALRIIDARAGLSGYMQGHVPGAIYLNTETLRLSRGGVPAQLWPPKTLADIFGQLGLKNTDSVVVYSSSEEAFSHAAYVAFVLEYLGHSQVAVLDGGFEKWKQENRPLTTALPSTTPGKFRYQADPSLLANAGAVQKAVNNDTLVLDARKLQPYSSGHIPEARRLSIGDLIQTNGAPAWKPVGELEKQAREAGVKNGRPVITYCTSGREASQLWFTLRHVLGVTNARVYHGSWIDWTSKGLPKQTSD